MGSRTTAPQATSPKLAEMITPSPGQFSPDNFSLDNCLFEILHLQSNYHGQLKWKTKISHYVELAVSEVKGRRGKNLILTRFSYKLFRQPYVCVCVRKQPHLFIAILVEMCHSFVERVMIN